MHGTFPKVLLSPLLHYLWRTASIPRGGVFIFGAGAACTWAAVRGQVAVAVAVARRAAVDAAVIVVGAGVGPRVGQPGLGGRLPDVQQTGPVETGQKKKRGGVNKRHEETSASEVRRPQKHQYLKMRRKKGLCSSYLFSSLEKWRNKKNKAKGDTRSKPR